MELQLALLLIGCIIVGVVALTAYERVRFSRRRLTADSGAAETPAVITRVRQTAASTGLDINPGPPHEQTSRFLKSHAAVAPAGEMTAEGWARHGKGDEKMAEWLEQKHTQARSPGG